MGHEGRGSCTGTSQDRDRRGPKGQLTPRRQRPEEVLPGPTCCPCPPPQPQAPAQVNQEGARHTHWSPGLDKNPLTSGPHTQSFAQSWKKSLIPGPQLSRRGLGAPPFFLEDDAPGRGLLSTQSTPNVNLLGQPGPWSPHTQRQAGLAGRRAEEWEQLSRNCQWGEGPRARGGLWGQWAWDQAWSTRMTEPGTPNQCRPQRKSPSPLWTPGLYQ